MPDIVVCHPYRSPVGAFGGQFSSVPALDLASQVLIALMERSGLDPSAVEDVVLGQGYPSSEAPALGRVAALDAGLPVSVPGRQVDRRCGSGLQAILDAAGQIALGGPQVTIAGGAESMSQAPFYSTQMRWGVRGNVELLDSLGRGRVTAGGRNFPVPGGMIETAENVRREYSVTREDQDRLAVQSQERATAAAADGTFAKEIIPISVPGKRGKPDTIVETDEHIRPDTTFEKLSQLRPIMLSSDPDATVTAGNASGQNDGAAMCIVTTREAAERHGLRPLARLVSWAVAGVPPATMGIGPVPSSRLALERAGLTLADIDLIEINEAFASQALASTRELGLTEADWDRINVHGSGISLGHPIGATGARILTTMLYEMERRGSRYGLETMCIGGGQGLAAVFERIE